MAVNVDVVVDSGMDIEESLRRSREFEPLLLLFASAYAQMRIFATIILPQALLMNSTESELLFGGTI